MTLSRPFRRHPYRWLALLTLLLLVGGALVAAPTLLWAYNLERAGRALKAR